MPSSLNINDVLSQVKQLNKEDQFTLLQRLTTLLKRKEVIKSNAVSITALSGVGSEIWKSAEDIDNYIDMERQW